MYLIPATPCHSEIEIKKSRFLAYAFPAASRKEAFAHLHSIRCQHAAANHHCWAYIIGNPAGNCSAASDDDGEPGGTAGRPILNVLQHKQIGNIMLIVTRYFGGIRLGAGGLVRAYSGAAESVMKSISCRSIKPMTELTLHVDFADENLLRHWLTQNEGRLSNIKYDSGFTAVVTIPESSELLLTDFIASIKGEIHRTL